VRLSDDDRDVSQQPGSDSRTAADTGAGRLLLGLYDEALPEVYGYLLARCGMPAVAEDLTAETFLAAVDAVRRDGPPQVTTGWLLGVARHKLADHWRQQTREQRKLRAVASDPRQTQPADDPWEAELDAVLAHQILARLAPQHRLALTLRYVDDLPVGRVAETIGRTVHATEALLVRAKAAFRRAYTAGKEEDRA
jgi:RNA polymerase sigma-70 factor (ECF subfamily)